MRLLVFDIETYKHLFCLCGVYIDPDVDGGRPQEAITVRSTNGKVGSKELRAIEAAFIDCDYIISYNGSRFDLPVLAKMKRDIERLGNTTTKYIYADAMALISYDGNNNPMAKQRHYVRSWSAKHFDLFNNCLLTKSLKQWEMYAGLPIRELPYAPSLDLTPEMEDEIVDYCRHDVVSTAALYMKFGHTNDGSAVFTTLPAYIQLLSLWPEHLPYKFDRTVQALASGIVYGTQTPIPPSTNQPLALFNINDFGVPVDVKIIIACLAKAQGEVIDTTYEGIKFGKGGAHFVRKGLHHNVVGFDVVSQYPRVIRNWRLLKTPQAMARWSEIMEKRFAMSKLKGTPEYQPHLDKAYKLVLNSLSGGFRMRSGSSVGFDPAAGEAMCYIAQLLIAELALAAPNRDQLIEVNTDSVFVTGEENVAALRIKTKQMFERYDMEFEEEFMPKVYFRDVNNYIVYDENNKILYGKGLDYKDMIVKRNEPAVTGELFRHLLLDKLDLDWGRYGWRDFVYKYHKSAASKYAMIGGEQMTHKNYYFLWTTRDCPDATVISFSRDLIDRKNGAVKTRYGVWAHDEADLEAYAQYIDYAQYQRDLDVLFDLWGKPSLCTTLMSKLQRKNVKSLGDVFKLLHQV